MNAKVFNRRVFTCLLHVLNRQVGTCFKELIWNLYLYLSLSWMDKKKKIFWERHRCLGTHTARAVTKQICVWNWAKKIPSLSKIGSSIPTFSHALKFISANKVFSTIVWLIFTRKVICWGLVARLLNL